MNAKQQYGQGLSGFMMGLLLATVIIGGGGVLVKPWQFK